MGVRQRPRLRHGGHAGYGGAREPRAHQVRALNSGFGYPNKAVTINLAPANVRKEGAGFDLPMAVGILGAMGSAPKTNGHLLVGELSLDGTIRPVRGALSIAVCARENRLESVIVPQENAAEAAVVEGVRVFGVRHLSEVVALLEQPERFTAAASTVSDELRNPNPSWTSATCAGRPPRSAPSKSPPRASTTCS